MLFVSVGVWEVSTGFWVGWLVVLFVGLGAIVSAVPLASGAGKPTLDADGLQMTTLFRGARFRWRDVAGFKANSGLWLPFSKKAFFDVLTLAGQPAAKLNVAVTGRNSALADAYGLSADALAHLLQRWRDRAAGE